MQPEKKNMKRKHDADGLTLMQHDVAESRTQQHQPKVSQTVWERRFKHKPSRTPWHGADRKIHDAPSRSHFVSGGSKHVQTLREQLGLSTTRGLSRPGSAQFSLDVLSNLILSWLATVSCCARLQHRQHLHYRPGNPWRNACRPPLHDSSTVRSSSAERQDVWPFQTSLENDIMHDIVKNSTSNFISVSVNFIEL